MVLVGVECMQDFVGKPEGKKQVGRSGDLVMWTGFIRFRIGTSSGLY
jgi:hypothetical protein